MTLQDTDSTKAQIPDYHLTWDKVSQGYIVSLAIKPDDGISVAGVLRLTTQGVQGPEQQLQYSDLVPKWSHKMAKDESLHMTITLGFHTSAVSTAKIVATCKKSNGTVHQGPPYDESYTGQHENVTDVFVWASL